MKNVITTSNFNDYKVSIINSCSTFGAINNPDSWYIGLNIFEFENESVQEMTTSLLFDEYIKQLKNI